MTASGSSERRRVRWELLSCALSGHVLVGTDAAAVRPEDGLVVRPEETGGMRWHRCLRCDAWLPRPAPDRPGRAQVPGREEIEIPLRGRPLRDRYVLRLIALDRFVHVILLTALGVALLVIAGNESVIRTDFDRIVSALQTGGGAPVSRSGVLGSLRRVFTVTPAHLRLAAVVLFAYAALEATEMVGLWLARRWAEYLTFVATVILVPFEIYEIYDRFSVLKTITLILNLAIVVYLLVAKRLFGIRGGGRAIRREREEDAGWDGLVRAHPWGAEAAGPEGTVIEASPVSEPVSEPGSAPG